MFHSPQAPEDPSQGHLNRRKYMKAKIFIIASMTIIALLPFAGCEEPVSTSGPQAPPGYIAEASSVQTHNPTAVESAIALSDKYAKLSEESSALRQRNQTLETENKQMTDDLQNCRSKLEQTQKELAEVNDLLVQMRLELNNWKSDVLGFRDEMRDAQKAQLEALTKILKLLGGEIKTETPQPPAEEKPANIQTWPSEE